jgi:serine/threonine protein kinase/tetratricopeptide (TPR) repeat protein
MPIGPRDVLDGRFTLERSVASGGMGVIFRGLDRQTGALVGVKTMRISGASERFEREIQILAALRHPGIVAYLSHGRVADELYLVMEWLEGEDLGARLDGGEVNVQQALSIGIQVADALGAAHRQGIVHRDVKPSNVFLADWRLDHVKLLDYGIARSAGMETLTGTGFVLGTPAYMAPEQAGGHRDIDARADVYALGALLFRCLAGRPPFEGDTLNELIAATLHRPAPPLGEFADVAPELEALVAQMLDKDPERRPADGSAACAALAGIDTSSKGLAATLHSMPRGTELLTAPPVPPGGAKKSAVNAPTGARATLSSVAVLSFLDMSQSKDQDYLCDGIAEELINTLAQLQGLRVAARSSSFQFKSSAADARAIGARLGVDAIVEGGVRKVADRLRVTVQLVDVADGSPRWSHRFDGKLDDVFAIQDQIAASVATALRGMLSTQERDALRRPGTTAEAYEHFLRGRQLLNSLTLVTSIEAAEREFRRAIEIDPQYAPAYAGLAQAYGWFVEWMAGGDTLRDAADRASRRALELGPELPESRMARAAVLAMYGDYQAAEREYQEAIRLNPNSFEAHYWFARNCFQMGKFVESVELFRRAGEIRVEDFQCLFLLELPLQRLGRIDEAAAARREGIRRAERQLELEPNNARALILGAGALVTEGQRERGLEWASRALATAPEDPAVIVNTACVYARAGMKEEALACLERTFGRGVGKRAWIEHDPDYDSLRDDPRFQALLAKLP